MCALSRTLHSPVPPLPGWSILEDVFLQSESNSCKCVASSLQTDTSKVGLLELPVTGSSIRKRRGKGKRSLSSRHPWRTGMGNILELGWHLQPQDGAGCAFREEIKARHAEPTGDKAGDGSRTPGAPGSPWLSALVKTPSCLYVPTLLLEICLLEEEREMDPGHPSGTGSAWDRTQDFRGINSPLPSLCQPLKLLFPEGKESRLRRRCSVGLSSMRPRVQSLVAHVPELCLVLFLSSNLLLIRSLERQKEREREKKDLLMRENQCITLA